MLETAWHLETWIDIHVWVNPEMFGNLTVLSSYYDVVEKVLFNKEASIVSKNMDMCVFWGKKQGFKIT